MRRIKLINEIYKKCEELNGNKATLVFILAAMTDKALTQFHKNFMDMKIDLDVSEK